MEMQDNDRLRQQHQRAAIISVAMAAGIPIYIVVAELLANSSEGFSGFVPDLPLQLVRGVAVVLGLMLLFVINMIRRQLLEGDTSLAVMVTQAMVPQERYASMMKATLVTMALCDALALLGLVLFLLVNDRAGMYAFVAAALVAVWMHFPRYHQWQRWYAQRGRVR